MEYEYKVQSVEVDTQKRYCLQDVLNEVGADGWEVITLHPTKSEDYIVYGCSYNRTTYEVVLKRNIDSNILKKYIKTIESMRLYVSKLNEALISMKSYEDMEQEVYHLPQINILSKQHYNLAYVVLSVKDGLVSIGGLCEDHGDIKHHKVEEMSNEEIVEIFSYFH